MSPGVATGSRLDQLVKLRARIDLEIRAEHARTLGGRIEHRNGTRRPEKGPSRTSVLLSELGVTSLEVKRWAVRTGRIPAVVRGRVPYELVVAYAKEHQS